MPESITITDNRTGESIEIPILHGGVSATEWSKLLPGIWFYDPGFMATAACESAITYLDGEAGILRYRGYPIEQLAEQSTYLEVAYLLLHGELPDDGAVRGVAARDHVPHVHPRERAQAVPRGLPLRRPPDGDARLGGRRPVDLLPRRQGHLRPRVPPEADHPADRQDADPGRRRPPLQRGHALRLPGQLARLHLELPLDDVEGRRAPLRGQPGPLPRPRRAVHPARRPRAELLDDRHAGGRLLARRSLLGHRRRGGRPLRPPPRRCQRAGHQDAHRDRHDRQRARLHRGGEGRRRPAAGVRPPRLQELRPEGEDHQADRRRGLRGHRQEPAARHRPQARGDRPQRRVLHVAPALPERRLLLAASSTRRWASRSRCSRSCSPSPARSGGWPTGRSCSTRTPRSPGPASSTSAPTRATTCPIGGR